MTSGPMGDDEGLLTGPGPPHVMIGRQTRYRQAVVQGWLAGEVQRSSVADNR
jgi:hypothetical protein